MNHMLSCPAKATRKRGIQYLLCDRLRSAVSFPLLPLAPSDIVELHPKPEPASAFGSRSCAATALQASGRTDGQSLAKQDRKGTSHAREVRGANHHSALRVGLKVICVRCQFEQVEGAVRTDQREQ